MTNLKLATTTSAQDSGLLASLIPPFERAHGMKVEVQAVGSGLAFDKARKGEADVILTHDPKTERELQDAGIIVNYRLVMHNDFILVGPPEDPARIRGSESASKALHQIAQTNAMFVSRSDASGTHVREQRLWQDAASKPSNYYESKTGMAQTLHIASDKKAYTLADRATYLTNKHTLNLEIMVEGDEQLLNVYHVAQVSPEKFPGVNAEGGKKFVDYLVSNEAQEVIGNFMRDKFGSAIFIPDGGKTEEDIAHARFRQ